MATQHLDLDEQEQIANLKHFWKRFARPITIGLSALALAFAAWQLWQHGQTTQAQKASVLYEELMRAVEANDLAKVDRAFSDMKSNYPSTNYTAQAALLDARMNYEKTNVAATEAALTWVIDSRVDAVYKDVARLRLAGVWLEAKKYDEAIKLLNADVAKSFAPLVADRLGDAYSLQNKEDQAKEQYLKAYKGFDSNNEYRTMVEVKLAHLGVDATQPFADAQRKEAGK